MITLFQLPAKLDEIDTKGDLALDLALQGRLDGIAQTLVKHRVNVNRTDALGLALLHKAIRRGTLVSVSITGILFQNNDVPPPKMQNSSTTLNFESEPTFSLDSTLSPLPSHFQTEPTPHNVRPVLFPSLSTPSHAFCVSEKNDTMGN